MAYTIEAHSIIEPRSLAAQNGTRELVAGGRGTLTTPGLALHSLMDIRERGTWNRAYVIKDSHQVVCVWAREDERIFCVGHTNDFRVRDSPPYLYADRTQVVTHLGRHNFRTIGERDEWAAREIRKPTVGSAVVVHTGRVYFAWEPDGITGDIRLVSNGPRVNAQSMVRRVALRSSGDRKRG